MTILDAAPTGVASGCSKVNAGSICPAPWNGTITQPSAVRSFIKGWWDGDPIYRFNKKEMFLDPYFWRWAIPYCFAVMWWPWRATTAEFYNQNLGSFLEATREIATLESAGCLRPGRVVVALDGMPVDTSEAPKPDGAMQPGRHLSRAEAVQLEPCLTALADRISIATHYPDTPSMHCGDFAQDVADVLKRKYAVEIQSGVSVSGLAKSDGHITGIVCSDGREISVAKDEAVLICCGAESPRLLEPLGVRTPIYPFIGYSITVKVPKEFAEHAPCSMVVNKTKNVWTTKFTGDRVRFTSIVEFGGGHDTTDATNLDFRGAASGLAALRELITECFPGLVPLLDRPDTLYLCGARPQSADDVPLVGKAPRHSNLYINAGHGQHGWSMAAGTGEIAARTILGLGLEEWPLAGCLDPARFDAFQAPWKRWR